MPAWLLTCWGKENEPDVTETITADVFALEGEGGHVAVFYEQSRTGPLTRIAAFRNWTRVERVKGE